MNINNITITVLVENSVNYEGLIAEHGLSFWIETKDGAILWDTGQSGLLLANAQKLGVDLTLISHIVISHGHYDHTGGLPEVVSLAPQARIHGHPGIFAERFAGSVTAPSSVSSIGIPVPAHLLRQQCSAIDLSSESAEILPGIFTTGEIPRPTDFEDTGGRFFLDMMCTIPDPVIDDQALFIESARGLVVILGCAHAGVVNTLDHIAKLTSRDEIYAVFGGTHLLGASQARLEKTAEAFARYDIKVIGPCHCTGLRAVTLLRSRFPDRFLECSTGSRFEF